MAASAPRRRHRLDSVTMGRPVITLPLRSQEDVLLTRRRARDLAGLLQLGAEAQSRLATAVWEVARIAHRHGSAAEVALSVAEDPPAAVVTISGIARPALTGEVPGEPVDRLDLAKLRQLVDRVEAQGAGDTALVRLTSELAADAWLPGLDELAHVLGSLQRHESGEAQATVNELRMQNAELVSALATVRERERELTRVNHELTDTNRAVTALLAELGHQADELRERAVGHASFVRALTHDLRTPLYAVRGMAEAILRDGDHLDARLREDIRLIDGAMKEALDLVNDHLDLDRMAAGREAVRISDVEVEELFSALRGIVAHLPRSAEVTIVIEDTNSVPTLRTDGLKVTRILRNYVVNGLKYTDRGEVRVSAVSLSDGAAVRFAVADTGPGLQISDQARIFEEFVQLGRGRGDLHGWGLGLPICKHLATLLGGEVGVTSEPGRGSTFTATIPAVFANAGDGVDVVEESA
jgi:signal transduction histidine kinase